MIEQGLVMLVQGTPAVSAIAPRGGFLSELPKDCPLPSWSYKVISNVSDYGLNTKPGLNMNRMQIDCYGATGASVINLAKAIDNVLSGFSGVLSDPGSTLVDSCFQSDLMDFDLDAASRTWRRMLEYEVWFIQQ